MGEGREEGRPGTLVPSQTKIPGLTGSLEMARGSASRSDPPSCRSDQSES